MTTQTENSPTGVRSTEKASTCLRCGNRASVVIHTGQTKVEAMRSINWVRVGERYACGDCCQPVRG